MVTECMMPALWAYLSVREADQRANHHAQRQIPREHGRPLEHTSARSHQIAAHSAHPAHSGADAAARAVDDEAKR
jgi:chorismate--pyruvate lyase